MGICVFVNEQVDNNVHKLLIQMVFNLVQQEVAPKGQRKHSRLNNAESPQRSRRKRSLQLYAREGRRCFVSTEFQFEKVTIFQSIEILDFRIERSQDVDGIG